MSHLKTNPKIKLPKPSKAELEKSIKEIGYRNTDRKYGVCDNTSRRWAMAYGIVLVAKCVLKSRQRKETVLKNGRLVYKKDITPSVKSSKKEKVIKVKKEKVKVVKKEKSVFEATIKVEATEQVSGQATEQATPVKVTAHPVIDLSKIKNRYSSAELSNFETNIHKKIKEVIEDIFILKESLARTSDNGTDDTAASGNAFEEGTAAMERENLTELVAKKQTQLNSLKNALMRVGNGTYGICVVTGELIPKERLLAVPHTTKCVEAKKDSDNGKVVTPVESVVADSDDDSEVKPRKFSLD